MSLSDSRNSRLAAGALPWPSAYTMAVCGLMLAAVVLRAPFLHGISLWDDEFFSVYYPRKPLSALWGSDWLLEPSPPLFYTVMKGWIALFGDGEPVMRLFPVLCSALTVPAVAAFGTRLGGRSAGLIAAALTVLAPIQFEYALEARTYAMQGLFIAVFLAVLARVVTGIEEGRITGGRTLLRQGWAVVPAGVLTLYSHGTSVFAVTALHAGFLAFWLWHRPRRAGVLIAWLGLALVTAVLAVPELRAMLAVADATPLAWLDKPSPHWVYLVLRSLLVGQFFPFGLAIDKPVAAAFGLLLAWSLWRVRRSPARLVLGALVPALGFALVVGASFIQPILLSRTVLWVTLPVLTLAATGLAAIPLPRLRLAAVTVTLAGVAALAVADMRHDQKQPWHALIDRQMAAAKPGDTFVAIDEMTSCFLDYYGGEAARPRRTLNLGAGQVFHRSQLVDLDCNLEPAITPDGIAALIAAGKGVWVTARGPDSQADLGTLLDRVKAPVAARIDMAPDMTAVRLGQ